MSNPTTDTCANPGCSEPGTNRCAGCKTTPYCGPICQTAHWPTHKESCDGRLRKMGMDHLNKAKGFDREQNWTQALRHSDLALTKLKQLKDRPIQAISDALSCKCSALGFLGRHREQLECAKDWYCLWNTKPTDLGAIDAAFGLIGSCINNKEYADAHLYGSTLYEIINHKHDNKIPEDERQPYIAEGAYMLATATLMLAQDDGIPPEKKQKAGQEAIALVRKALEIHIQLLGTEHEKVANAMGVLADILSYFNDDNDDEVFRLIEQTKAIFVRVFGSSSVNVALAENRIGDAYGMEVTRAIAANDLYRAVTMMELALPRFAEADRIYRLLNRIDDADRISRKIVETEDLLRRISSSLAAAATKG